MEHACRTGLVLGLVPAERIPAGLVRLRTALRDVLG